MKKWHYHPADDLPLTLSERVVSLKREGGLGTSLLHGPVWKLLHLYMLCFQRMKVHGLEHLPEREAFVMIANHSSHLDALVLGAALPPSIRDHACPVAAQDTFFTSAVRSSLSAFVLNALPLSRAHCGMHALNTLRARLVEGEQVLILFPEGTRTRTGEMGAFRKGIGMLVSGTAVPVVPCWIDGAFKAWPPGSGMPRMGRITLTIGRPLQFADVANDHEGWGEVAARLEHAVRMLAEQAD